MSLSHHCFLIIGFSVITCTTAINHVSQEPLSISNISVTKKILDVKNNDIDTIQFVINKHAEIEIQVWSSRGYLIKNLYEGAVSIGCNTFTWDGTDSDGENVTDGDYHVTIKAQTDKEIFLYDPYDQQWGDRITPEDPLVNVEGLKLYYNIPCACLVMIRVGIMEKGLLYKTIVNWEPRPAGPNVENWDGYDNSGLINVVNKLNAIYSFRAYSLPENVIIVKNGNLVEKNYPLQRRLSVAKGSCIHALHDRGECIDPAVFVSVPEASFDKDGVPCFNEDMIITVDMSKDVVRLMEAYRFEIMIFIDNEFYHEEETGYMPFRFNVKTSEFPEGKHILTVVVVSSHDHASSNSFYFYVDKRRKRCCTKK
jgi:hypothetical protein